MLIYLGESIIYPFNNQGQMPSTQELVYYSKELCIIISITFLHPLHILRLFQGGKGGTNSVKTEKLQAIFHYFRRITKESK